MREVGREVELVRDVDDVPVPGEAGLARQHDRGGDDRPGAESRTHRPQIDSPPPALEQAPQRPARQHETQHTDEHIRRGSQRRESRVVAEQPADHHEHGQPHGHHEHGRDGHRAGGAPHSEARARG